MKRYKIPTYLSLLSSGHGHYKITTTFYCKEVSMITNDMRLIDMIKNGSESAKSCAIKMIRYENRKQK